MRESEKVLRAPRGLPPESAFYEVILSLSLNSPRRISTVQYRRSVRPFGPDYAAAHGDARKYRKPFEDCFSKSGYTRTDPVALGG